jgi:hypothetical protein
MLIDYFGFRFLKMRPALRINESLQLDYMSG